MDETIRPVLFAANTVVTLPEDIEIEWKSIDENSEIIGKIACTEQKVHHPTFGRNLDLYKWFRKHKSPTIETWKTFFT